MKKSFFYGEFVSSVSVGGTMKLKKSKHRQSLYTIDFTDTIRSGHQRDDVGEFGDDGRGQALSPKPMTPRRVKRRSVMTRGSSGRQSSSSRRSSNRNSVRSSRRRQHHQNPVTKLMEQQTTGKGYPTFTPHKENPALTASNLKTLNSDLITHVPTKDMFHQPHTKQLPPPNPDPIYYNMSQQTSGHQVSWNSTGTSSGGHFNPTYQHSTPNLTQSSENIDELYNNRPPSVRSSYSNFHGARPLSSTYNQVPTTENVFTGLTQAPQLPQRRAPSRESVRSMAFLNSGPPAYNLNYHTPPDSETTM
uniref:Putative ccaat-binding transcription factor n=1 Tax=Nyssomyia neivai TaxID=330878 RepID=A0A1L8DIH6_9DIPT